MSVIVAIKKDGVVYIGCDSQVTSGGTRTTLRNENNYKIWKVNNAEKCLMGSVGNLRDACVVRTMDDLISEYNIFKNHISYQFIVNKQVYVFVYRLLINDIGTVVLVIGILKFRTGYRNTVDGHYNRIRLCEDHQTRNECQKENDFSHLLNS